MNIYHISYTQKFVGEQMAMLSFKGCNYLGGYEPTLDHDLIKEIRETPRKAKFIELLPHGRKSIIDTD